MLILLVRTRAIDMLFDSEIGQSVHVQASFKHWAKLCSAETDGVQVVMTKLLLTQRPVCHCEQISSSDKVGFLIMNDL